MPCYNIKRETQVLKLQKRTTETTHKQNHHPYLASNLEENKPKWLAGSEGENSPQLPYEGTSFLQVETKVKI